MRKLRTRILVGGAVAITAGAAAFAVTTAAGAKTTASTTALTTATAKAGTTLSITAGASTIKVGERDAIEGTLLANGKPAAHKVVELRAYSARTHRWRAVRITLTGKQGQVRFGVRPWATRDYELFYHGNAKLAGATSAQVTVTVTGAPAKWPTVLSLSAAPGGVKAGQAVKLTGTLSVEGRPLRHRAVALDRYDAATKKWVRTGIEFTGARGQVSFTREPTSSATFELVYAGGPRLTAAHSASDTVTVTG